MKLTRRDAILGATTGLVGGGTLSTALDAVDPETTWADPGRLDAHVVTTLLRLAAVVYPSEVTATEAFVRGYVGLLDGDHQTQIADAVADLDAYTASMHGRRFADVSAGRREAVLHELGVDAVAPHPTGSVAARVRYHLVNGLLYALFTSPRGSQLFGIDNPLGYPGGYHGSDRRDADSAAGGDS